MNPWWLIVAGVGLLVVSVSIFEARRPSISPVESHVFHAVNGLPDRLYPLLWLPMQLGNLVVGTCAGLAVALLDGDLAVAIGAIAAMVLKLVTERIVRKEMADYLAVRQRPGTSQVGALLRGDVPASGPSFPSGHVILVAAVACVVTPSLPIEWWWVPGVLTVLRDGRAGVCRRPQSPRRDCRPGHWPAARRRAGDSGRYVMTYHPVGLAP